MWKARGTVVWTRVRIPPAPQEAEWCRVVAPLRAAMHSGFTPSKVEGNPSGSTGGGVVPRSGTASRSDAFGVYPEQSRGESLLHLRLAEATACASRWLLRRASHPARSPCLFLWLGYGSVHPDTSEPYPHATAENGALAEVQAVGVLQHLEEHLEVEGSAAPQRLHIARAHQ
jgi:hypothetical protein